MTKAIERWIEKNETKFQNQTEKNHLIDFLVSEFSYKKSINFSYDQCVEKTRNWVLSLNKNSKKDDSGQYISVMTFDEGYSIVNLQDESAKKYEGIHMGNCVSSRAYDFKNIYSLRDKNNIPHVTMHIVSGEIKEAYGTANTKIKTKYFDLVLNFIKKSNLSFGEKGCDGLELYPVKKELIPLAQKYFSNVQPFNEHLFFLREFKAELDAGYDLNPQIYEDFVKISAPVSLLKRLSEDQYCNFVTKNPELITQIINSVPTDLKILVRSFESLITKNLIDECILGLDEIFKQTLRPGNLRCFSRLSNLNSKIDKYFINKIIDKKIVESSKSASGSGIDYYLAKIFGNNFSIDNYYEIKKIYPQFDPYEILSYRETSIDLFNLILIEQNYGIEQLEVVLNHLIRNISDIDCVIAVNEKIKTLFDMNVTPDFCFENKVNLLINWVEISESCLIIKNYYDNSRKKFSQKESQ